MPIPLLVLTLPPSVNKAYYYNHDMHMTFYGKESKAWFDTAFYEYLEWKKKYQITGIISEFVYCDLDFWLPRKNCDSHNYTKILFDGLQKFGLVEDDRYLLSRTQNIYYDTKNPKVSMSFSLYKEGADKSSTPFVGEH